jgi:hypothetical protein
MKVGYIGGFWATNIGNSFYNLGAKYLLNEVYGKENVYFIPDPPQWMWKVKNNYDFISNVDLDLIFISGPCLNYEIENVYKEIFDNFKENNIKIAFISVGTSNYTKDESSFVQKFLNNYEIEFMLTRDEETYELYKNCSFLTYNGLCTSMFLNDAVNVIPMKDKEDYSVMNFSIFTEPNIENIDGEYIFSKRKPFQFQKLLDNKKIIRINNTMFCRFKQAIFNRDNIYYSDLPYGYISILKHANIVFSDRVHTCAGTLIMGGKAMYIKGSKRSHDGRNNLFKRIKVNAIHEKPISLDFAYINEEKNKMVEYLLYQNKRKN